MTNKEFKEITLLNFETIESITNIGNQICVLKKGNSYFFASFFQDELIKLTRHISYALAKEEFEQIKENMLDEGWMS